MATKKPNTPAPKINEEEFAKELDWCVYQLEVGLTRPDLQPEQIQESKRVISQLRSKQTPYIKKRQIMATTFGDYRTWMKKMPKPDTSTTPSTTTPSTTSSQDQPNSASQNE